MAGLAVPAVIRDRAHERHIVGVAALAAGYARMKEGDVIVQPAIDALNEFSDRRAAPGDVLEERPVPLLAEAAEEFADARSYLVWRIQLVLDDALAGDSEAGEEYKRAMSALSHLLAAWVALTTV